MNYGITNASAPRFVADASPSVRAQFIRKVYSLFVGSVGITVLTGVFCSQETLLPDVSSMLPALLIVQLLVGIGLSFARRVPVLNMGLLALFAALWGAILAPVLFMANRAAPGVPVLAALLTSGVFAALTIYVFASKRDFSFMGGFLFVGLIGLLLTGLVLAFFPLPFLSALYSLAGVLIFSGYVLYDTSNIMNHLEPEETVVGAVELYLDFINLFLFILRFLLELNRRD